MKRRNDQPFFTKEQAQLIRDHMLKDAPEHEIERFMIVCERTGLDCFSRQIYGRVQKRKVKDGDKFKYIPEVVIITSIDGFRAIAERSGEYQGQTAPEWYYIDDEKKLGWHDVFLAKRDQRNRPVTLPEACRVGIFRKNFAGPCYGVANFESFAVYEKRTVGDKEEWYLGTFWNKMPEHMIAKVAEAQGIRKAFPLLAQGLYVEEEVQQDPEKETGPLTPPQSSTVQGTPVETVERPSEPEPEKPAEPEKKTRKKAAEKPAAPPAEEDNIPFEHDEDIPPPASDKKSDPWRDHVIKGLTVPEFAGKRVGDLSPEQIQRLHDSWVKKYADKIKTNPVKQADADAIIKAFAAVSGK